MNGPPPPEPASKAPEPRSWLLSCALAIAAMAVMATALDGPFLFDDVPLIEGNDRVHGFEHWSKWFSSSLWDTNYDPSALRERRGFWRPIILASYAVDWWVGTGSPLPFHVTNVVVHAANALLLERVLSGWVGNRLAVFFAALLFAVHPVQTEPVAWITGRTDSFCALGLLIATLGLRRSLVQRVSGSALLASGLLIAFGSKETAAVFPVFAAIELWSRRKPELTAAAIGRMLLPVTPFMAISVAFYAFHRWLVPAAPPLARLTPTDVVPLGLEAWGRYVALLAWPDDLTFGRAMVHVADNEIVARPLYVWLGALSALALALVSGWLRRTAPAVALGALAFGALLLPVSGVPWFGYFILVSPRFLYVPLIGVSLGFAGLLASRIGERRALRVVLAVVFCAWGTRSVARAADFSSAEVFWRREIEGNERYPAAEQFWISRELNAGRPRSALRLAHRWFQQSRPGDGAEVTGAMLVRSTLAAVMALTPDVDREGLRETQRVAGRLAQAEPSEYHLPELGLRLRVAANPILLGHIAEDRRHYLIMTAEAASRLGDDDAALAAVEAALEGCGDCWTTLATSALLVARSGELDRALSLAEQAVRVGPPNRQLPEILENLRRAARWKNGPGVARSPLAEVGFHTALGSFGRAYAVVQPVIEQLADDPGRAEALGEIAFRAGDIETARRLLGRALPAHGVDERLVDLSRAVRWFEQPREADEWVPP